MTSTTQRKPQVNVSRTVAVLEAITTEGTGRIRITERKGSKVKATPYAVRVFRADYGRMALTLTKDEADGGQSYDVLLNGLLSSCDCLGHQQWGHKTVCKHIACARKLLAEGQLPDLDSTDDAVA